MMEKGKVRLVAKGYAQRSGEDFNETYSPVARSSTIRLIAPLAAELNLEIHQMDVITAYLMASLKKAYIFKSLEKSSMSFEKGIIWFTSIRLNVVL